MAPSNWPAATSSSASSRRRPEKKTHHSAPGRREPIELVDDDADQVGVGPARLVEQLLL